MKPKTALKLLVGGAFVAYVLRAKLVDFGAVKEALFDPARIAWSAFCLTTILLLQSVRWSTLCRAQGLKSSPRRLAWLNWASGFVGLALFGSAGGDLVKAYYLSADFPGKKARAAMTVFVDRAVGSATYFFLLLIVFPLQVRMLSEHPELARIAWFVAACCAAGVFGVVLFFRSRAFLLKLGSWMRRIPARSFLTRTAILYRQHPKAVFFSLGYSFLTSLLTVALAAGHGGAMSLGLSWIDYLLLVPLGVLASYFSLLPFGIGVGQVVYFQVVGWLGGDPQNGAALCTLMQLHSALFYLTGVLPFVRMKRAGAIVTSKSEENAPLKRSA